MRSAATWVAMIPVLSPLGLSPFPADAADLYTSFRAGFSDATIEASGSNELSGTTSGEDDNSSPLYGGAVGVAVPLSDVLPWALRIPSFDVPYWPGRSVHVSGTEHFRFPGWTTLIEAEAITGRDFTFETDGPSSLTPYRADVTSTSFMANVRLDIPIRAPLNALFGRLPMLDPLTIYGGGGVGAGWNDLEADDTVNSGSDTTFDFAYQFMGGVGYALTDQTHLSVGWRYYNLGELEVDMDDGPNDGSFDAEIGAHEFVTALRFHFYHVPFFGRE